MESKRTGKEKGFNLLEKVYDKEKGRPACPVCGSEVIRPQGEVMYYCSNATCPAQAQQRIELFTSRGAMDVRGVGENLIALFLEKGLIKDAADLYSLTEEQIANLERMGEKSAANIVRAIQNSKERPLARLIYALGIRHVGGETAELLAGKFHSIEELSKAVPEDLMTVPGIGPKIAESIAAFFRQEGNLAIIRKLKEAGVKMEEKAIEKPETLPLSGMEFVLTGTLRSFSRAEAEEKVKALGGGAGSNVTRKTTYLVVGADPGSTKLDKARELGTKILNEEEFLQMLKQAGE